MRSNQVVNSGNELDFMPNLELITIFQGVAKLLKRDATMHLEHTGLLYTINEEYPVMARWMWNTDVWRKRGERCDAHAHAHAETRGMFYTVQPVARRCPLTLPTSAGRCHTCS